jgi:hypothetical protein
LHVLSLPPAFVLSQDQTLKLRHSVLAFLVTHESTRTFTPPQKDARAPLAGVTFSRNVSAKVSSGFQNPLRSQNPASLCRPRFSFFYIQLSKNRADCPSLTLGEGDKKTVSAFASIRLTLSGKTAEDRRGGRAVVDERLYRYERDLCQSKKFRSSAQSRFLCSCRLQIRIGPALFKGQYPEEQAFFRMAFPALFSPESAADSGFPGERQPRAIGSTAVIARHPGLWITGRPRFGDACRYMWMTAARRDRSQLRRTGRACSCRGSPRHAYLCGAGRRCSGGR